MEVTVARGVSSNGTPLFTCNTCGLSFPTAELQRLHMKTEWHRYNLKRRVAQLPPISAEIFAEKILQQQSQAEDEENFQKNGGKQRKRQVTKKDKRLEEKQRRREASNKAAEEVLRQKHSNIDRPGSPDTESVDSSTFSLDHPVSTATASGEFTDVESTQDYSDIETTESQSVADHEEDDIERAISDKLKHNKAIPPNCCFITGEEFETAEDNAQHLLKKYGMFIPEREYLVDFKGLMTYLGEKVGLGNMCLYCNYEARTLEAVRAHMLAKSHVKIPYDTLDQKLEISDYYDFRSSYESKVSTEEGEGNDEDWEDEEVDESEDEEYLPVDYDAPVVTESGLELAMGNLRAGHRSLARYYKQNVPSSNLTEDKGTLVAADRRINNLVKGRDPVRDRLQKQTFRELERQHNRERRRETKTINFQTHYRDQLLQ